MSYQKGFQWYLPCPPVPLKFVAGGGEGTSPSPAEWLPATAGGGRCVINLQANPPAVAARQIKELTHLCLQPAAKGSWEESRVGAGGRARAHACVLLIDKKGRASSSERSPAPSKCRRRRRRGKKKRFLFPCRSMPKSNRFQRKRWSLLRGPGQPPARAPLVVVLALLGRHLGFQLCPRGGGWRGWRMEGLFEVCRGSSARQWSAGALRRKTAAICLIFSSSTVEKSENQHGLHVTSRVLARGSVNLFVT